MKNSNYLSLAPLLLMAEITAFAQTPAPQPIPQGIPQVSPSTVAQPSNDDFNSRLRSIVARTTSDNASSLTRFTLDFPGGTPKQLAAAIEQAMGRPLNVIVPDDVAETKLPPIKVNNVTVPQLFQTLSEGSHKYGAGGRIQSNYGFQTIDGPRTDESIWTFFVSKRDESAAALTRFNLDFPGGSPRDLVAAIQKALGKPLNAIVPDDLAEVKLPTMKMKNVNAAELFNALMRTSAKDVAYTTSTFYGPGNKPSYSYQVYKKAYGFKTEGTATDDSIWYFFEDKPAVPPGTQDSPVKSCRFYLLTPYLDRGLTVDDITTAIQSGWKMLGEKETPAISFHKETKLLIAVGEPGKLETIDAVLKALEPPAPAMSGRRGPVSTAPLPASKPAEPPNAAE